MIYEWINGSASCPAQKRMHTNDRRDLEIDTLEGTMKAKPGDYIIKGVNGEFYPCKPEIFKQTYELVGEQHD